MLLAAAKKGYLHVIRFLLQRPNVRLTPNVLYESILSGHYSVSRWLVRNKCPLDRWCFLAAKKVQEEAPEFVRWFLANFPEHQRMQ